MSKFGYTGSKQYQPITAWGYVGYGLLFSIPLIGLILLIVFAFSDNNYNRRSYARSYFCWVLVLIVITTALVFLGSSSLLVRDVRMYLDNLWNSIRANSSIVQAVTNNSTTPQNSLNRSASVKTENEGSISDTETSSNGKYTGAIIKVESGNRSYEVHKSFKEAMDEYEAFFDEYVAAMKSQSVLQSYDALLKYTETLNSLSQIEEENLTSDELAYYLEVYSRIMQKLATTSK